MGKFLFVSAIALVAINGVSMAQNDPPKPAEVSNPLKPAEAIEEKKPADILVEDAERREELKTINTQSSYKRCLNDHASEGSKKTYSQKEIEDYCGCFAVLINERVTNAEWQSDLKAGRWEKNPKLIATNKYCRDTYKGLPDVTALKKRKW
jgi:hypothetical protein